MHWCNEFVHNYNRTCVTTSYVVDCDWGNVRSLKDRIGRLMMRTAAAKKLRWSQFCYCRSLFFAFSHGFKMQCSIENEWEKHFLQQCQFCCECSLRRIRLCTVAERFLLFRVMPTLMWPEWGGSSLVMKALMPLAVNLGPLNQIKSNNNGTLCIGVNYS